MLAYLVLSSFGRLPLGSERGIRGYRREGYPEIELYQNASGRSYAALVRAD